MDSINTRIHEAGWFDGSETDWQGLTQENRESLAFAATGCECAFPTWRGPVDCLHVGCRIRRGELPKIALTNSILRGEMESGWLRFDKETTTGRKRLAAICRAYRKAARETGIYDPWKLNWRGMVFGGIVG